MTMLELATRVERLSEPPAVGAASSSAATRSIKLAVSLETPAKAEPGLGWCLSFRNFYVAALRVEVVFGDGEVAALAESYQLMKHLHCEDDAQDWHALPIRLEVLLRVHAPVTNALTDWLSMQSLKRSSSQMTPVVFTGLRLHCQQPSTIWAKLELHNVKLYQHDVQSESTSESKVCGGLASTSNNSDQVLGLANQIQSQGLLSLSAKLPELASHASNLNAEDSATRCVGLVLRIRQLLETMPAT